MVVLYPNRLFTMVGRFGSIRSSLLYCHQPASWTVVTGSSSVVGADRERAAPGAAAEGVAAAGVDRLVAALAGEPAVGDELHRHVEERPRRDDRAGGGGVHELPAAGDAQRVERQRAVAGVADAHHRRVVHDVVRRLDLDVVQPRGRVEVHPLVRRLDLDAVEDHPVGEGDAVLVVEAHLADVRRGGLHVADDADEVLRVVRAVGVVDVVLGREDERVGDDRAVGVLERVEAHLAAVGGGVLLRVQAVLAVGRVGEDREGGVEAEVLAAGVEAGRADQGRVDGLRIGAADAEQLGLRAGGAGVVIAEADAGRAAGERGQGLDRDRAGAGLDQPLDVQLVVDGVQRRGVAEQVRVGGVRVAGADRQVVELEDALQRRLELPALAGRRQAAEVDRQDRRPLVVAGDREGGGLDAGAGRAGRLEGDADVHVPAGGDRRGQRGLVE